MTQASNGGTFRTDLVAEGSRLADALTALRDHIHAIDFVLEAPRAAEAREIRREILDQIDGYLLPRLRRTDTPLLVVVAGSTGAGKSTLVNSLVGARVSSTGVRRPTTNSPVLACHPDDVEWFGEDRFLPALPRVRQQGLARPGRDGILVLASNEQVPKGVALLDTPDIDSVVETHHEFARTFLDAADVWLFVTTAARYADARVWEWLERARERDATLAVVLSRVPGSGRGDVEEHFQDMLAATGLGEVDRFFIPETSVTDGALPESVVAPISAWIGEFAADEERRLAAVRRTLDGVLDRFRTRVPELARQVEEQVAARTRLRGEVEAAYAAALAEIDEATRNGSLLRGEVLARWQDFVGTGELFRAIRSRRGRGGRREAPRRGVPGRPVALKSALRASLEALVTAGAERAAEDAAARWRADPAGAALLRDRGAVLARASDELSRRVSRAVSAWQDHVVQLVESEGVTKRSVARIGSFDEESLALVFMIGLLGYGTSDVAVGGTSALPQRLLKSLFGAESLRNIGAKARSDLRARIGMLLDEEAVRFSQVLDAAGVPDETAAVQLYQATYNLEVAR